MADESTSLAVAPRGGREPLSMQTPTHKLRHHQVYTTASFPTFPLRPAIFQRLSFRHLPATLSTMYQSCSHFIAHRPSFGYRHHPNYSISSNHGHRLPHNNPMTI